MTSSTRITKIEPFRVTMHQIIVSHNYGEIAAEGSAIMVGYHYSKLKKAPITDSIRQIIVGIDDPKIVG
ncbi:MAG: acyl-CoA thioesterase FadM [Cellvibrionaceae bacterium]|jgi:acyl-CoA thioesterase FadM